MERTRKLVLVGYGKMGRLIDSLAPEYGFEVVQRIASSNAGDELQENADVAIEFSLPETAAGNLRRLANAAIPAVCGTTGWLEILPEIKDLVAQHNTALVWSANFSPGVAVFRRIVGEAAKLLSVQPGFEAWAWEIHHKAKKDAPSGTMLQLLADMRASGFKQPIDVATNRAGKHPGTHEIGFDSAADTITLKHEARNREGFARGALEAARWIEGQHGVFTFDDVLFGPAGQ